MIGDHGAVAFEFALICPIMLLLCAGIFGVGVVMVQEMELNFVVENAAKVEAASPGNGVPWATTQLASPPVSFTANSSSCGGPGVQAAQATGTWPVSLGVLDAVTFTLSAQACAVK